MSASVAKSRGLSEVNPRRMNGAGKRKEENVSVLSK